MEEADVAEQAREGDEVVEPPSRERPGGLDAHGRRGLYGEAGEDGKEAQEGCDCQAVAGSKLQGEAFLSRQDEINQLSLT